MRCLHAGIFDDHELGGDIVLSAGFERNGIEVERFDYRAISERVGSERMNQRLLATVTNHDFVFIGKGELLRAATLRELSRRDVLIALWYGDLRESPPDWLVELLPHCDVFFMTSAGRTLRQYFHAGNPGMAAFFLFPGDPGVASRYDDLPRGSGPPLFTGTFSSFVGEERRAVLRYLHSRSDTRIVGSVGRYIENDILRSIYRRIVRPKVLRGPPYFRALKDARFGIGVSAFQNVKYYTSDRLAHYLTLGTPFLAYRFPGCEDLFVHEQEVVFYDDVPDLARKMDYYINNPDRVEVIGRRGQEKMLGDYSTTNMTAMMLDVMASGDSDRFDWSSVIRG